MSQVISVIIPVYNSQDTIELALKSVLAQTQGRFEIIIINDGSFSFMWERPISLTLFIIMIIIILLQIYQGVQKKQN